MGKLERRLLLLPPPCDRQPSQHACGHTLTVLINVTGMFGFTADFLSAQKTQQLAATPTACYKQADQHVSQVRAICCCKCVGGCGCWSVWLLRPRQHLCQCLCLRLSRTCVAVAFGLCMRRVCGRQKCWEETAQVGQSEGLMHVLLVGPVILAQRGDMCLWMWVCAYFCGCVCLCVCVWKL